MTEKQRPTRSGLGRGLSALMADVAPQGNAAPETVGPKSVLAVHQLVPNKDQPRRDFPMEALTELADSIRVKGIVQPLIVRPSTIPDQYEIVAGERRWRAAQMAELHEVPVLIRSYTDEEVLEIAIIENIQRADLNAVEEALAYRQLMDRFGHTQDQLALSLSRSRSHIANTLRLLNLPDPVLSLLREGKITAGHARTLVTSLHAEAIAHEIVKRGLSVREAERLAKMPTVPGETPGRSNPRGKEKDADTRAIEADLSANLRMNVQITHRGPDEGGVLSITYRTLDDLDMLCDVLSKIPRDIRGQ